MGKVLIVGATGYIGLGLLSRSKEKFITQGTSTRGEGEFIRLNLEFPEDFSYESVIANGDFVVVTAAISAPDVCANEHERAWAVNVNGTASFIKNAINRGARVIFLSSDTVYGECKQPFEESRSLNPTGEYAQMKSEIEHIFQDNSSFKSARLSYVFSRDDKFTKYLFGCIERDEEAEIYHPFSRSVIHRGDVIDGVMGLIEKWNEVSQSAINFGGPEILSRVEFKEIFNKYFMEKLKSILIEPPPSFFLNRPKIIAMQSPVLKILLGRPSRTLVEAMKIEFPKDNLNLKI